MLFSVFLYVLWGVLGGGVYFLFFLYTASLYFSSLLSLSSFIQYVCVVSTSFDVCVYLLLYIDGDPRGDSTPQRYLPELKLGVVETSHCSVVGEREKKKKKQPPSLNRRDSKTRALVPLVVVVWRRTLES